MGNLAKRILSAAVLVPFILLLVFYGGFWIFFSLVVSLATLLGFELGSFVLDEKCKRHRFILAGFSGLWAASVGIFPMFPMAVLFLIPLILFLCFSSFLFSSLNPTQTTAAFGMTLAGSLYTGSLTGFLALLFSSSTNGNLWVFTLLLATFLGDTFAYGFGKTMGRHRLSAIVSPNKTWEGSLGSLLGTTLSVFLANYFFLDISTTEIFVLSLILNVACQLGDLSESYLKRGFGVKDSGKIIPGHGGFLDRVDALIFGAPVMYFFILLR